MKDCIINGKKYTVEYVFNMVGNYEFVDEDEVYHLVDAQDVSMWAEEHKDEHATGVGSAIAYAKYYAEEMSEDGVFWWKRYKIERDFIHGSRKVEV